MKAKHRVLFSFFVLLIAYCLRPERGRAHRTLARIRRSVERASDAFDRLDSSSAVIEDAGPPRRQVAWAASAAHSCPDWLVDYFRSQSGGRFDGHR